MWEKILYFLGAIFIWTGLRNYLDGFYGLNYLDVLFPIIIGVIIIYVGRRIGKNKKDQKNNL